MLLYPLDTVKTRIKPSKKGGSQTIGRWSLSPLHFRTFTTTPKEAVLVPVLRVGPSRWFTSTLQRRQAKVLPLNDIIVRVFFAFSGLKRKVEERNPNQKISVGMSLLVAALAAASVVFTEPLDTLSTRAQVGSCPKKEEREEGERWNISKRVGRVQQWSEFQSKRFERRKKEEVSRERILRFLILRARVIPIGSQTTMRVS